MNFTEGQKLIIKSKLTTIEDIHGGLYLFLQRKHNGEESLNLDSLMQTILDQDTQIINLKDIIVTALGIEELDPAKKTYPSNFY